MPVTDVVLWMVENFLPMLTACTGWVSALPNGDPSDCVISGKSIVTHDANVQSHLLNVWCLFEIKLELLIENWREAILFSR